MKERLTPTPEEIKDRKTELGNRIIELADCELLPNQVVRAQIRVNGGDFLTAMRTSSGNVLSVGFQERRGGEKVDTKVENASLGSPRETAAHVVVDEENGHTSKLYASIGTSEANYGEVEGTASQWQRNEPELNRTAIDLEPIQAHALVISALDMIETRLDEVA